MRSNSRKTARTDTFKTLHRIIQGDARLMENIPDETIHSIITSPPYPMIAMWDSLFTDLACEAGAALADKDGPRAFELMHLELDKVWAEALRVLVPGGFACINIGDATRTLGANFALYPNHSRIEMRFLSLGFDVLPRIIWRKTTNAPNKFMGSGMLPAGAYVTQEHEYILVFRKKGRRRFTTQSEKAVRRASAIFWEERNAWYSDLWQETGARQRIQAAAEKKVRGRSAAFPMEIAQRLAAMYSLIGDTVADPFLGTGTVAAACVALARNSIGIEIDRGLCGQACLRLENGLPALKSCAMERLGRHADFCTGHLDGPGVKGYINKWYGFPVKTRQEKLLVVPELEALESAGEGVVAAVHAVPAKSLSGKPAEKPL